VAKLIGLRKAATLIMGLDGITAIELLKGRPPEEVQEIALLLAQVDASGQRDDKEEDKVAREFLGILQKRQSQRFSIRKFLNEMLSSVLGSSKAAEIKTQILNTTQQKDPFIDIRTAMTDELVLALKGQHPQTIATVLGELSPQKCQGILELLDDETRAQSVYRMTSLETLRPEMKRRIAEMVDERLAKFKGEVLPEGKEQTLRRLAVVLGGMKTQMRDDLLEALTEKDDEIGTMVRTLMITWEDITSIADRSLQECLRNVEAGKMALALFEADPDIASKLRSNISERAVGMLDEEISLMQEPMEEEVTEAREEIVRPLREANEAGTLRIEK
jgi:flagellar motor switch protein FliG